MVYSINSFVKFVSRSSYLTTHTIACFLKNIIQPCSKRPREQGISETFSSTPSKMLNFWNVLIFFSLLMLEIFLLHTLHYYKRERKKQILSSMKIFIRYFKVFMLIEAAAEKKRWKAERKTLSNFDDTERGRKDAERAKTSITTQIQSDIP